MSITVDQVEYHYVTGGLSEEELDFIGLLPYTEYSPQFVSPDTIRAAKKRCRELGKPIPHELVTALNRAMRDAKYGPSYDVVVA